MSKKQNKKTSIFLSELSVGQPTDKGVSLSFRMYCRCYQRVLQAASYFVNWRRPYLIEGENCVRQLPDFLCKDGIHKPLVITDRGISSLGLMDSLLEAMDQKGIPYEIYDETVPNPSSETVEQALAKYRENDCDGLIAFGGGSPMDCAKAVGARIVRPEKSLKQMQGVMKIHRRLPMLYAIPTTAGTGSETTLAAVITDTAAQVKYQIDDTVLIPSAAFLDPYLTVGLPAQITSTTGMDALTHAVEAYLGKSNTRETREMAETAVQLIFENLQTAYRQGNNLTARANMLKASHYAGIAFTRAYVGYVHALAHAVGGLYHTPHGLANSVILPYVLSYYGSAAHKKLARLADLTGITENSDTTEAKAERFIEEIRRMNRAMNIPAHLSEIREEDIPLLTDHAVREANPLYPVPRILGKKDMEFLLRQIGNHPISEQKYYDIKESMPCLQFMNS